MIEQKQTILLDCRGYKLDLSQPQVMGILNVTPDSFSDGGLYATRAAALQRAAQMVQEGAAIIDVGGESTRPGSAPVSVQEELDRVIPIVEQLAHELPVPISVDTHKPKVMRAAIAAGAHLINDIKALQTPLALEIVAESTVAVCLMHMQGEPATMQQQPYYQDVVVEVSEFLAQRAHACLTAGIAAERMVLDPGFGFGKLPEHNLQLLRRLDELQRLDLPLLVGWSRKATIGKVLDRPASQRLFGSLACAVLAVVKGARLVRAHDVQATVEALKMTAAVLQSP